MKITSQDFEHGQWIPSECAYGKLQDGQFALSSNLNPQLSWTGIPEGTQSVVLACIDPDVPTDRKALNESGEIPAVLRAPIFVRSRPHTCGTAR